MLHDKYLLMIFEQYNNDELYVLTINDKYIIEQAIKDIEDFINTLEVEKQKYEELKSRYDDDTELKYSNKHKSKDIKRSKDKGELNSINFDFELREFIENIIVILDKLDGTERYFKYTDIIWDYYFDIKRFEFECYNSVNKLLLLPSGKSKNEVTNITNEINTLQNYYNQIKELSDFITLIANKGYRLKFGRKLKGSLKRKNLNQTLISEYLSVQQQTVSTYYSGKALPDLPKIRMLADIIGCDYNNLLDPNIAEVYTIDDVMNGVYSNLGLSNLAIDKLKDLRSRSSLLYKQYINVLNTIIEDIDKGSILQESNDLLHILWQYSVESKSHRESNNYYALKLGDLEWAIKHIASLKDDNKKSQFINEFLYEIKDGNRVVQELSDSYFKDLFFNKLTQIADKAFSDVDASFGIDLMFDAINPGIDTSLDKIPAAWRSGEVVVDDESNNE